MCCTPDSAYRRHVLDCVGREWLLVVNHPHYFGSRSVQTSDELGHHLNVGHDQAGVMMQSKRRCHRPLAAHVFKPILWGSAEESCRLRRPHILHHTGVMSDIDTLAYCLILTETVRFRWHVIHIVRSFFGYVRRLHNKCLGLCFARHLCVSWIP